MASPIDVLTREEIIEFFADMVRDWPEDELIRYAQENVREFYAEWTYKELLEEYEGYTDG
jgi:hypothetical protein